MRFHGPQVDFVDGHWRGVVVLFLSRFDPVLICPDFFGGLVNDRCCAGAVLHVETIGITFGKHIAILCFDFKFINGAR